MSHRVFALVSGVIFLLIALGHLVRLLLNATFVVEGVSVPMLASGLAVVVMGYLAFQGFRLGRRVQTRP